MKCLLELKWNYSIQFDNSTVSNITTEMMSMVSFNINMTSELNMSEPELVSSCEEENMTLDIATGKLFEPQKRNLLLFYRIWDMLSSSLYWASATGQNLSRGGYHHHGSWFPGKGKSVFISLFHYYIILCQWLSVIPGHKRIQISWEENIHAEHGLVSL